MDETDKILRAKGLLEDLEAAKSEIRKRKIQRLLSKSSLTKQDALILGRRVKRRVLRKHRSAQSDARVIREGRRQVKAGKVAPWEGVKKKLDSIDRRYRKTLKALAE